MRISNFGLRLIDFTYLKLNASNVLKTFFKNINICIVWTFLSFSLLKPTRSTNSLYYYY